MSVRMALAKLCACTCGGAIIGGGAVHVAESARPAGVHSNKSVKAAPKRYAVRTVKRKVVKTVSCAPQTVSVTTHAAPIPLPAPVAAAEMPIMSGGGGVPVVMAGGGGFGGGGFIGGFFGGSGGGSSGGDLIHQQLHRRHQQLDQLHDGRRFDFDRRGFDIHGRRVHFERQCVDLQRQRVHFERECIDVERKRDEQLVIIDVQLDIVFHILKHVFVHLDVIEHILVHVVEQLGRFHQQRGA